MVRGVFGQPGIDEVYVAEEMRDELREMVAWLGLERGVEVSHNGDLSPALRQSMT